MFCAQFILFYGFFRCWFELFILMSIVFSHSQNMNIEHRDIDTMQRNLWLFSSTYKQSNAFDRQPTRAPKYGFWMALIRLRGFFKWAKREITLENLFKHLKIFVFVFFCVFLFKGFPIFILRTRLTLFFLSVYVCFNMRPCWWQHNLILLYCHHF